MILIKIKQLKLKKLGVFVESYYLDKDQSLQINYFKKNQLNKRPT